MPAIVRGTRNTAKNKTKHCLCEAYISVKKIVSKHGDRQKCYKEI